VVACEPNQQLSQLRCFGVVEPGEQFTFGFIAGAPRLRELPLSGGGDCDDVPAAIMGIGVTPHQSLLLQPIEERDHRGAIDAEAPGRLLLGLGLPSVEEQQHRQLADVDARWRQVLLVQLLQFDEGVLEQNLAGAGHDCRALIRREAALPPGTAGVRGDLDDPRSLQPAVEGIDAVVHLAALFRSGDEDEIRRANLDGTRSLIEAIKLHARGARVVMASTSNVYDADSPHPGREDDTPEPVSAYPASKLAAEALLRNSGLTWSILRFPFVYGEGDGHLESMPALAARHGLHPAHTYSVVHHRDIAVAIGMALAGTMDGRVVNVTDDADVTVHEIAELAGQPIEESAEPLANPWAGRMDGRLIRELGFQPTVPTARAAARDGLL
jgi:nucleoside-diphosphate-sugar epimerase